MAKKTTRGDVNRSEAVRNYLEDHPDATASVVVPALAQEGITVSGQLVNNVRSTLKKKAKKRVAKRGRRPGRKKVAAKRAARPMGNNELSTAALFEAKQLADDLGGIDQARKALDTLEQLR